MRDIAYITDETYFLPTKVSINSIVQNVRDVQLTVHVVSVGLPDDKRLALQALGSANVRILVHNLSSVADEAGVQHFYVSAAAGLKPRLPYVLPPDVDRVLYVDGDTILFRGVVDIFDVDISDVYAAVVKDMCAIRRDNWYVDFGLKSYFNTGAMFLNLKKMREDRVLDAFDVYFHREDIPKTYYEQSPLNATFGDCVRYVGLRYNFISLYKTRFEREDVLTFFEAENEDYDSPAILHLAGSAKPWRTPAAPDTSIWLQYVPPESALAVAKNYCENIRDGLSGELAKQAKALSAVGAQTEGMRGQFRIQATLGANLISDCTNGVLLSGFEREEKWGRWTTGNASIRVWSDDFLHTGGDLLLYARLRSFNTERRVSLVFNGTVIHEMTLPVESSKIAVKVAKSLLRSDNMLEIRAEDDGKSPVELGIGTDTRKLCLGIEYMRLADNIGGALAALGESDRQNRAALAKLAEADRRTQSVLNALGEADRRNHAELLSALAKHKDENRKEKAALVSALNDVDQRNKAAVAEHGAVLAIHGAAIAGLREENSHDRAEFGSLADACAQDRAALATLAGKMEAELAELRNANALLADRLAFLSGNVFIRTFLWLSEMKRRLLSIGRKKTETEGEENRA